MAKSFNLTNLKKTYYYLKRNGLIRTFGAALERVQSPYFAEYTYQFPLETILEKQKKEHWKKPVLFSVVVPAYETREDFLDALILSMIEQTYPYWELIIADASSTNRVKSCLETYTDNI